MRPTLPLVAGKSRGPTEQVCYPLYLRRKLPTRMYYASPRLRSSEMEAEASKCPRRNRVSRPRFPVGTQGGFCPQQPRSACEPSGVQAWHRHACLCAMQGMHYPRAQARVPVPPAGTWRRAAGDANAPEKPVKKEDAGDRGRRADSRVNLGRRADSRVNLGRRADSRANLGRRADSRANLAGVASAVQDLLFSRNR